MKKALSFMLICLIGLAGCSSNEPNQEKGSVYYLNFKPEQDEAWQKLARTYTELTQIPVTIVTAASGNYETTLMAEMAKSSAPTLFQVNGPIGLANWQDFAYDLSETKVYDELTSEAFALKNGEEVSAIAYVVESYGLIVNEKLLNQAGYQIEEIDSFDDLKKVSEDITARKQELGFSAFTSAGLDASSDWRFKTHLANMPIYFEYQENHILTTDKIKGTYLKEYRNIFDLYIQNSTVDPATLSAKTADDSRNEFLAFEAVFYQNGSWEYANLIGEDKFNEEDLTMIPIYIGVNDEAKQGLTTGTENYWVVNKEASDENIQATLDFMNWCVTSETGTLALANEMGFVIPFEKAQPSKNLFVKQDVAYTRLGKQPISWNFTTMPSEEWKNGVGQALTIYAAQPSDENWTKVEKAFVEGWADEYELMNQK